MSNFKLNKWQAFWRLLLAFVVGEAVLFGLTVWLFEMTASQIIGLGVAAAIILIIFIVRTWNNPVLNE